MMIDDFIRRYQELFGNIPHDVPDSAWADIARQIPNDKCESIFDALTEKGSRYASYKPKPYQIIPLIKGQAQAAKPDAYSAEYVEAVRQSKMPLFSRDGRRLRTAFSGELPAAIRQEVYAIMQAAGRGGLHGQHVEATIENLFDVQFTDYSQDEQAALRRMGGRMRRVAPAAYSPEAYEADKAMRTAKHREEVADDM